MSIAGRKIGEWRNPIVDELDKPVRSASEMKAIFDSNSNELKEALNGTIDDIENGEPAIAFRQAAARTNIATGETLKVIFGKIRKLFADLTNVAFSASYNDLVDAPIPLDGASGQVLRCRTSGTLDMEWAYGSGSAEQIQPDLTDEDPTSVAYVRNRPIVAENIVVQPSAFILDPDETSENCPYKAAVDVLEVAASMNRAEVTFREDDRYMFAGICKLVDGGIEIYASFCPTEAITIPTVVVWR